MKANLLVLPIACIAMLFGGCVLQCINPLFTEKEYISYPALAGTWMQKEALTGSGLAEKNKKDSIWRFEPDGKRYKLTHTDEYGHKATFHVAVGKIGTNVFLSSRLDDPTPDAEMNIFAAVHFVPTFTFAKIRKDDSGLALAPLDIQWFASQLEKNPKFIPHTLYPNGSGGDVWALITATTEELQRFVAEHAEHKDAFKREIKLLPAK